MIHLKRLHYDTSRAIPREKRRERTEFWMSVFCSLSKLSILVFATKLASTAHPCHTFDRCWMSERAKEEEVVKRVKEAGRVIFSGDSDILMMDYAFIDVKRGKT